MCGREREGSRATWVLTWVLQMINSVGWKGLGTRQVGELNLGHTGPQVLMGPHGGDSQLAGDHIFRAIR